MKDPPLTVILEAQLPGDKEGSEWGDLRRDDDIAIWLTDDLAVCESREKRDYSKGER